MNTFEGQHHYEILKIALNADVKEIERAYREALEIYEENSLITYTLFSEDQRSDLLQAIDEAYHTLMDAERRAAYNQYLIDSGVAEAAAFQTNPPEEAKAEVAPAPTPTIKVVAPSPKHRDLRTWVQKRSLEEEIKGLVAEISARDTISGSDLKKLRQTLDIQLEEIFELTRISTAVLTAIEENRYESLPAEVFLKGFLKTYAQMMQIDPKHVIAGYLKNKTAATSMRKSK
ncbi:MAG: helix-turn-helix domain-containing protein [Desulfobacteraceae bacterium]|nr:helix-turn-helix domain-containing protein [Desulfobacteraceae bacterium]